MRNSLTSYAVQSCLIRCSRLQEESGLTPLTDLLFPPAEKTYTSCIIALVVNSVIPLLLLFIYRNRSMFLKPKMIGLRNSFSSNCSDDYIELLTEVEACEPILVSELEDNKEELEQKEEKQVEAEFDKCNSQEAPVTVIDRSVTIYETPLSTVDDIRIEPALIKGPQLYESNPEDFSLDELLSDASFEDDDNWFTPDEPFLRPL